jgi:hypothetical protein
MRSLPVPETLLKRHCDNIAPIFAKKRMQILQVRCDLSTASCEGGSAESACAPQSVYCAVVSVVHLGLGSVRALSIRSLQALPQASSTAAPGCGVAGWPACANCG